MGDNSEDGLVLFRSPQQNTTISILLVNNKHHQTFICMQQQFALTLLKTIYQYFDTKRNFFVMLAHGLDGFAASNIFTNCYRD